MISKNPLNSINFVLQSCQYELDSCCSWKVDGRNFLLGKVLKLPDSGELALSGYINNSAKPVIIWGRNVEISDLEEVYDFSEMFPGDCIETEKCGVRISIKTDGVGKSFLIIENGPRPSISVIGEKRKNHPHLIVPSVEKNSQVTGYFNVGLFLAICVICIAFVIVLKLH